MIGQPWMAVVAAAALILTVGAIIAAAHWAGRKK